MDISDKRFNAFVHIFMWTQANELSSIYNTKKLLPGDVVFCVLFLYENEWRNRHKRTYLSSLKLFIIIHDLFIYQRISPLYALSIHIHIFLVNYVDGTFCTYTRVNEKDIYNYGYDDDDDDDDNGFFLFVLK